MAWVVLFWPGYFHFGLGIFKNENAQAIYQMIIYDTKTGLKQRMSLTELHVKSKSATNPLLSTNCEL